MKISEMRNYLKHRYNGKYNGVTVDEMPDDRVIAIYYSMINRKGKAAQPSAADPKPAKKKGIIHIDGVPYIELEDGTLMLIPDSDDDED